MASTPITLEVAVCDQRRSYLAVFANEDQAMTFVAARMPGGKRYEGAYGNHAFFEVEEAPIDFDLAPRLYDFLNPTCEHGLSAHLCAGPQHYPYDDEERQHYGF